MKFSKDLCIVGGCGRVGLPLGLSFAKTGLKVSIYDIDEDAVEKVRNREMPYFENGAEEILSSLDEETLEVGSDPNLVSQAETVVIIIGTPVDGHLNPSFHDFSLGIKQIEPYLRDGQLLILRSTVYPGTTTKTARLLSDWGKAIDVSFCPERVAEGKAIEEIRSLPQIVSGVTERALRRAAELFRIFDVDIIELSPREAELAKLFTNSWRYIQFATANQFYMMAEQHGLDFHRIYEAMRHKYPRTQGFPGAGFTAGPCLFKDTMQLAAFNENQFFLGHSAMLVNEGLPSFLVNQLKATRDISELTIGILGMAFKGDIDDPRSSLSYKLKKILEFNCDKVLCTDPYVPDPNTVPLEQVLRDADIIFLGAPHTVYKNLKIDSSKTVIDIWNMWPSQSGEWQVS